MQILFSQSAQIQAIIYIKYNNNTRLHYRLYSLYIINFLNILLDILLEKGCKTTFKKSRQNILLEKVLLKKVRKTLGKVCKTTFRK